MTEEPAPVAPQNGRVSASDLEIARLGPARITSPMAPLLDARRTTEHYVDTRRPGAARRHRRRRRRPAACRPDELPGMEPCGPRRKIFFDPSKTRAGHRHLRRAVSRAQRRDRRAGPQPDLPLPGPPGGRHPQRLPGLLASYGHDVVELTPESVRDIAARRRHRAGHLARPAGPRGDRRLPRAAARQRAVRDRRRRLDARRDGDRAGDRASAACGSPSSAIPKTIDNDIPYIDQSFGFQTAFCLASDVDPGGAGGGQVHARTGSGWSS